MLAQGRERYYLKMLDPGPFVAVPEATLLWRFLDLPRLLDLLQHGIYFTPISELREGEKHEGQLPLEEIRVGEEVVTYAEHAVFDHLDTVSLSTAVSCWHLPPDYSDHEGLSSESAAMWKIYAGLGKGVAVLVRMASLNKLVREKSPEGPSGVGQVEYHRPGEPFLVKGSHSHVLSKKIHYEYEREVRAICSIDPQASRMSHHPAANTQPGVYLKPDDLSDFLHSVVISPWADWRLRGQVEQLLRQHAIRSHVLSSRLTGATASEARALVGWTEQIGDTATPRWWDRRGPAPE